MHIHLINPYDKSKEGNGPCEYLARHPKRRLQTHNLSELIESIAMSQRMGRAHLSSLGSWGVTFLPPHHDSYNLTFKETALRTLMSRPPLRLAQPYLLREVRGLLEHAGS